MYRATTPKHTFVFEINPDDAFDTILITYAQMDRIILEKHKDDLVFGETSGADGKILYTASVRLTQLETRSFSVRYNGSVDIQVRALTPSGEALASDVITLKVQDVLNDEVLI